MAHREIVEAFLRNPALVQGWYAHRRAVVEDVEPNPGHAALAELEGLVVARGGDFLLATQNVDGLHLRAGEFVADEVESLMDEDSLVAAACAEIVQRTGDRPSAPVRIRQHVVIPEANHLVTFTLDHLRSSRIRSPAMLSPVNLDDELRPLDSALGIGDFLRRQLQELACLMLAQAQLGLDGSIRFLGARPQDELPSLYQAADVVAVPVHRAAGTRLKVLEAMAVGLPVLATRQALSGLKVEHRKHCFICERPADFAEGIQYVSDAHVAGTMGLEARKYVEANFSMEELRRRWREVIGRLADSAGKPAPRTPTPCS